MSHQPHQNRMQRPSSDRKVYPIAAGFMEYKKNGDGSVTVTSAYARNADELKAMADAMQDDSPAERSDGR